MEQLLPVGLAIAGFVLGALVFSRVGHWLVGIHTAIGARTGTKSGSRTAALASAVLFASGPWVLAAMGLLAFYSKGQEWASWLFSGVGAALLCFGVITIHFARRAASSK